MRLPAPNLAGHKNAYARWARAASPSDKCSAVSDSNVGMPLPVKPRDPVCCRPGVLDGNFAEELLASDAKGRPGFVLDRGGAFDGTSTAKATFTAQGAMLSTAAHMLQAVAGQAAAA